ncbi:substrate-binding domain-containing protein [Adlercreutzia sp. ZJ304]|uniref:substrate-binding domain-containing protein n=1 Tax=Adlercreutzia sp. ZJ304 TaxID=2709791 RepID=UPI001F156A04|nr:substrate-binding domain-containing protein [Adlercreutzia sp. ZJ304]
MVNKKAGVLAVVCTTFALAFGAIALSGCGPQQASEGSSNGESASSNTDELISVYSREDGSGTRGAFIELFGIEQKDDSGKKVDMTTDTAAITNSTSVMMTSVAGDPAGIGYISLGSLNDTVKALNIDGVEATTENVKNGSYAISRPFNIVTGASLSEAAQDFVKFIMSADGQKVVSENDFISVDDAAAAYSPSGLSGKVVVAGSSSVTPVMEKLAEAYKALNPDMVVEVQQSDSTTGVNMAVEGTCDIGMASRELKDSETAAGVSSTAIALDGIAVIVAPESSVTNLTADQVMRIYTGEILSWSEVA